LGFCGRGDLKMLGILNYFGTMHGGRWLEATTAGGVDGFSRRMMSWGQAPMMSGYLGSFWDDRLGLFVGVFYVVVVHLLLLAVLVAVLRWLWKKGS